MGYRPRPPRTEAQERRRRARREQRELDRLEREECRLACAAAGWIRRDRHAPYTGAVFMIDGEPWLMIGWLPNLPGLELTSRGQVAHMPIADLKDYGFTNDCVFVPRSAAGNARA